MSISCFWSQKYGFPDNKKNPTDSKKLYLDIKDQPTVFYQTLQPSTGNKKGE
jgi:hypothetical protein